MAGTLERLVEEDYGIHYDGKKWAHAIAHDSLIIDCERELFWWNSKNIHGDSYTYLTRVRGLSHDSAKELLRNLGFSATFIQQIKDGEETIVYEKLVEIFHENLLEGDKTYFYNRTLTDDTINRFKLGTYNGFYTIPIYQDGLFKNFQLRRDSPKIIRQYYKNVGPLLFNSGLLKVVDKVYITEGLIGAMVLMQNGVPAVSMNMGCDSFMPEWIKYFTGVKEIVILFDNDQAGTLGAVRTAKILGESRCMIYNFFDFEGNGFAVDDFFIDGGTKDELFSEISTWGKRSYELENPRKNTYNSRKIVYSH
jgi:hypothetical protein